MEESELFVFDSESRLQIKSGDVKNAVIFKLDSAEATVVGGAKSLQDTISVMSYKLKSRFGDKYVVPNNKKFELGEEDKASEFQFISASTGGKYAMKLGENKYVSSDAGTSDMQESADAVYFKLQEVEAPLYGTIETGHKRLTSDGKSLTMNPLNFFAEAKL